MKRILYGLMAVLLSVPAYAQQWDQVNGSMQVKSGPTAPLVIIDQTAAGQKILSLRNNGTEKCYVDVSGNLNCAGTFTLTGQFLAGDGSASAPSHSFASDPDTGGYWSSSSGTATLRWSIDSSFVFGLKSDAWTLAGDVFGAREAAGHFFQRNSTNAQRASWANTYTSSTNYEAFSIDWQTVSNSNIVGNRTGATGTSRRLFVAAQNSSGADDYAGMSISRGGTPIVRFGLYGAAGASLSSATATEFINLVDYTNTATSGTIIGASVKPTYNQSSGTAANTDLLINRTETAVGSGAQNLLDAQVGSSSKFRVDNSGNVIWNTASGPALTQGSATGLTVSNTGASSESTYKVVVDRTAFVCAATTCDLTIGTLPANSWVYNVTAQLTTTFACTATCTSSTLSMMLGKGSGGAEYLASGLDIDAATAYFGDADAEMGTLLTRAAAIQGGTFSSTTQAVVMRVTSGTGNIGTGAATNFSQGSITIWVTARKLP